MGRAATQAGRFAVSEGPPRARWVMSAVAGLGAAALLSRSSDRPVVLGRYSTAYASLILVYLVVAAAAVRNAWSAPRWEAVRKAWSGVRPRSAAAWALFLGIPLGMGALTLEQIVPVLAVPLLACLFLALGLTFVVPGAAGRWLGVLGRWGRGSVVSRGALVMLGALVALVTVEVALRARGLHLLLDRGPYVMDPAVGGFRLDHGPAGNRLGFLDYDEYAIDRQGVAYRVVAIGDSFTMGWRVPLAETWKRRLEVRFREAAGERVEIINLGIGGAGPEDYLRVLKTMGLRLQPDLVLVGFYVGNDFTDNEPGHEATLVDGWPMEVRHLTWFGGLPPERLYVITYLTRRLKPVLEAHRQRGEFERGEVREAGTFSRETFLRKERDWLRTYEREDTAWFRGRWAAVQGWLREMHQRARASGAEFVLAVFPAQIQVEDELRREVLESFHLNAAAYDFEKPQRVLRTFAGEAGIRIVDMLPRFRAEGRAGGLYQVRDEHWNAAGNRLAADLIHDYLMAERLAPQRAQAER